VQCLQPVALGGELVVSLLEFCCALMNPLLQFGSCALHFGKQARIVDRLGCLACQRECDLCILIIVGADSRTIDVEYPDHFVADDQRCADPAADMFGALIDAGRRGLTGIDKDERTAGVHHPRQ